MYSTLEPVVRPQAVDCDDPLFQLQLRVARRADEVVREGGPVMPSLMAWLQAEREILSSPPDGARGA